MERGEGTIETAFPNEPISRLSEFLGHSLKKSRFRFTQINLINLISFECK